MLSRTLLLQSMARLDDISDRILQELTRDGRISNLELARRVGLSPSAFLRRVQELERDGIIKGYRARVNREALGRGFVAYVTVGLSQHSRAALEAFESAVDAAEQVRECHSVAGSVEYLLRVEVADLSDYKAFHADILGALPQVTSIRSYVVMDSPKDEVR